jgi:very-short-patch-repair endonuclease
MANRNKRTSIEQLMHDDLIKNNIDFSEQYPIGRYVADFALLEHNIIIECDGEYWHNKEKDSKRDADLKILGYETIRFSEKQLKNNIDLCIKIIKERLHRGNFTDYERL